MSFDERIATLESTVRRQRFAMLAVGLAAAAAVGLGMGQDDPKELTLEGLTIVKDGKPRLVLGTNPVDQSVGLALLDERGKPQASLGQDPKGDVGFIVLDRNAAPKVIIGTGTMGSGIVLMGATLTELPPVPAVPTTPAAPPAKP